MASGILKAITAVSLLASGGVAAAQGTAPLASVQAPAQRAGESIEGRSQLEGTTAWILAAISLGLIIFGIIEFTSDQENSNSP